MNKSVNGCLNPSLNLTQNPGKKQPNPNARNKQIGTPLGKRKSRMQSKVNAQVINFSNVVSFTDIYRVNESKVEKDIFLPISSLLSFN